MGIEHVVVRFDQPQSVALELRDYGLLAGAGAPDFPPVRGMKSLGRAGTERSNVDPASADQIGGETSVYCHLKLGNAEI